MQEKLVKAEAELAEHRSTTDSSTRTLRAELAKVFLCSPCWHLQAALASFSNHTARRCTCAHTSYNPSLQVNADLDRVRKQEKVAKAQIFGTFNPEKLSLPDWKVAQANMKQRLAQLEEAATQAAQVLLTLCLMQIPYAGCSRHV